MRETAAGLLVRTFGHILSVTPNIVWLQQAVTVVTRGSVARPCDARNVSSSVVAKDGGENKSQSCEIRGE